MIGPCGRITVHQFVANENKSILLIDMGVYALGVGMQKGPTLGRAGSII